MSGEQLGKAQLAGQMRIIVLGTFLSGEVAEEVAQQQGLVRELIALDGNGGAESGLRMLVMMKRETLSQSARTSEQVDNRINAGL